MEFLAEAIKHDREFLERFCVRVLPEAHVDPSSQSPIRTFHLPGTRVASRPALPSS